MNRLRFEMPGAAAMADARTKIDSLPSLMDAIGKLPAALRDLPPAPVIIGAASRMVADAVGKELQRRGPSAGFMAAAAASGLDEPSALRLHDELVMELGR